MGLSPSAKRTSLNLFGGPRSAKAHDFPERLETLRRQTDGEVGELESVIHSHSLYGFYLPWLTAQKTQTLLQHAETGSHHNLKYDIESAVRRLCFERSHLLDEWQNLLSYPLTHLSRTS